VCNVTTWKLKDYYLIMMRMRKLLRIAPIVTMERIGSRSPKVADPVTVQHPTKGVAGGLPLISLRIDLL
jgi:hypothetical protein